jgi:catechol 2,3-dioxygenase-like lactoylglutathione lyase family enzyme
MTQTIGAVAILVPTYDEGLRFFVGVLGFTLVEDTPLGPGKRWVTVEPPGGGGTRLLLAEAATDRQRQAIGDQAGGRVFLFLHTDDFRRDHRRYLEAGVVFLEVPRVESYGTVAVFRDPFGNRWDLIEPTRLDGSAVSVRAGSRPLRG